ncbi:MAG: O-antigen ligase family protein [Anaerolineales bacterium]|nr:O-antigen ligase family protein [Anaerolineales bacterium]MCW5855081.1 O-antigen ligase family protein [Anaerolineales bacterium]
MQSKLDWTFLGRQTFLILAAALALVAGGGFGALVDFRLQVMLSGLAIAVLGGWLLWRLLHRQRLAAGGLEWAWLAFLLAQLLAAAFSEDVRRSLPHLVTWWTYFAVFCLVLDLLRRGWPARDLELALFAALGLVLLSGSLEWWQMWQGWRMLAGLQFVPAFAQRVSSLLGDPNLLAACINLLLPLLLVRWMLSGRLWRALLSLLILVSLGMLYLTDSRGALLGFGACILVLAVLWVWRVSPAAYGLAQRVWAALWGRKWLLAGLVLLLALAAGLFAWRMLSFQGDTTHGPVLTSRDVYWQAARNALASDPLTGAGQGLYPTYLMGVWSMPPGRPYFHAHSLYFHTLAESGWLGLLTLAVLGFSFARRAWNAWQGQEEAGRARWAAALAGLAGLAIHSIVDDFFAFASAGLVSMALMAFALAGPRQPDRQQPSWHPAWLLLPGLLAAGFSLYALRAHALADVAWQLGREGDWPAAAQQMAAAAATDPGLAAYWLQAGYAQAQAGNFAAAIESYRQGIALEPVHGLNYANLAAIHWAAGDPSAALIQMRIATRQSLEAWQFWLTQAVYEESLGEKEALSAYQQALYFNSDLRDSLFWQGSALRQQALAGSDAVAPGNIHTPAREAAALGRAAVAAGDPAAAADALGLAFSLNDQEVLVYVGLAELAMAEGDLEMAQGYLNAALWVQTTRNQSKVEAILLAAEIATQRGDAELALLRYEAAFASITAYDTYGWGSSNWSPYFWFAFQRRAFPNELLPWLERADVSPLVAQRLLVLAELYEKSGNEIKSAQVRTALAGYLP